MKTITIDEAKNWIENAIENELVFGLRGDDFCPVDNFENSTVWDDGIKFETELNGLCAIGIDESGELDWALKIAKKYGDNFFLIIGDDKEYGNDSWNNEIIISNHSIYAKVSC